MTATNRKMRDEAPGEIEALLPWRATDRLDPGDARRVDDALANDPALARQYAVIQNEYAETIGLNERLGAPSPRAMQKLFAAIDAEPAREHAAGPSLRARVLRFFSGLSPRTLVTATALAALALLLQAGVIGASFFGHGATFETASYQGQAARGPQALVRFVPDARVADITAFLEAHHAAIIGSAPGGMFRLQFGERAMTRPQADELMARLSHEKIISLAVTAQ